MGTNIDNSMAQDCLILLVENNVREAQLLKVILENEGFMVDYVVSGGAALKMIRDRKYASAVLDFVAGYEGG